MDRGTWKIRASQRREGGAVVNARFEDTPEKRHETCQYEENEGDMKGT